MSGFPWKSSKPSTCRRSGRDPPAEAVSAGHGGGDYFEVMDFVDAVQGSQTAADRHPRGDGHDPAGAGQPGFDPPRRRVVGSAQLQGVGRRWLVVSGKCSYWPETALAIGHSVEPFEDAGCAHSAADAHGDETKPLVLAYQLVQHLHRQLSAGAAQRVAECNGAAVDVDRLASSSPSSRITASACTAKASFNSTKIDLVNADAGQLERLGHGRHRADSH